MTARRTVLAAVGLFVVYIVLSLVNDPAGYLGTDTGGKVATFRAMEQRGDSDPDVGYWAEQWDPDGTLHPLYYTNHVNSRWVNVTTLPAVYLALPLYRVAGYRGALVVPMVGAVACALAAAALARRLGASDGGRLSFWMVGFASPVTIYALDFWEHTLGLALMAWAVVVLVDLALRTRPAHWGVVAGALFGAAATMRTEALVYGLVATAVVCLTLVRRNIAIALLIGASVAVGLAVPLFANSALERAVLGGSVRSDRAQGTVSIAGDVGPADRIREAAITSFGATGTGDAASLLIGVVFAAAIAYAVVRRDGRPLFVAAALLAARAAAGLGFIPGLFVAAPLALTGLIVGWRRGPPARLLLIVSLAALPLVWVFQFAGGAGPQWGGRYILLTGFALTVVGVVQLGEVRTAMRRGVLSFAVVVTLLGVGWMSVRTHAVADSARVLARRPEPVLVSRVAHLVREGGAVHDLDRWLTALTASELDRAAAVAFASGARRIAVVDLGDQPPQGRIGPFTRTEAGPDSVEFLPGVMLRVTTYER